MNSVPWSLISLRLCLAGLIVLSATNCSELAPEVPERPAIKVQQTPSDQFNISAILREPDLYLERALDYYRSDRINIAREIVNVVRDAATDRVLLSADGEFLLKLLVAHFELDIGRDPSELVRDLRPVSVLQRLDALELWTRYLQATDRYEASIASLMAAKKLARDVDPTRQSRLNTQLWDLLIGMPSQRLVEMQYQTDDPDLIGWIEIAGLFNDSLSVGAWLASIEDWVDKRPQHESVEWLLSQTQQTSPGPKRIAILLPQSGSDAYAQAARGIRDGWLLAYMVDKGRAKQNTLPEFTFYDTVGKDREQLILDAFEDGADHVVGPLSKDAVNSIQATRTYPGSILMLNAPTTFGSSRPGSVRYLAWTIEDEAFKMAQSLSKRNHVRCVVIYGNEPWMIRARAEFELNIASPTRVISVNRINEFDQLTEDIGATIGIEESERRHEGIESIVQFPLEFQPRMNQEINSIVAFIDSSQLEAVLESLRFHADRPLDIYVTDSAVRGKLTELANGVQFTTDTWRIFNSEFANTVNEYFDSNPNMASFYAMGIDAYRFSNLWSQVKVAKTIAGHGSRYRLEPTGNFRRLPYWGVVRNRTLTPLSDVDHQETRNPYL
ncbi:MAG: penicillin-binding protein activator [Gammaproteobacteria bacterium]|nr:penicillin-binding protein activator [Gammaproteobacteria bacterium]